MRGARMSQTPEILTAALNGYRTETVLAADTGAGAVPSKSLTAVTTHFTAFSRTEYEVKIGGAFIAGTYSLERAIAYYFEGNPNV